MGGIRKSIEKQAVEVVSESVALSLFSRKGAIMTIQKLARQLGINITKRKVLQLVPALGALVGGVANAWYINDIATAARRSFQERWLMDNRKYSNASIMARIAAKIREYGDTNSGIPTKLHLRRTDELGLADLHPFEIGHELKSLIAVDGPKEAFNKMGEKILGLQVVWDADEFKVE